MSSSWRTIDAIFHEAVAIPRAHRAGYLAQRCQAEPDLQAEVESLLAAHDSTGHLIDAPAFSITQREASIVEEDLPPGRRIGRYVLTGLLGRGGLGVVYEARQLDPPRTVALKVMRARPMVDEPALRLFEREGRALARLAHAGVAALYEAGHEGDSFYFAMECVRGTPLTLYARERGLSLPKRLDLFVRVCEAVHYAHQRGVIHRDLKPSNILVTDEGLPKVLDFGLARVLHIEGEECSIATECGAVLGTLTYMSPEQARGTPAEVDTRSDVYALGVVLCELLTDRLPLDLAGKSLPAAAAAICGERPNLPRNLPADLAVMLRKALEKDPAHRYQSVSTFADDVERVLTNRPILARPPSAVYQLRKLVSRHRVVSGLIVWLLMLMVTFGVAMSVLYRQAERLRIAAEQDRKDVIAARDAEQAAREDAERKQETATAVQKFMAEILTSHHPQRNAEFTVREALDQAVARVDAGIDTNPGITDAIRMNIGRGYLNLSAYAQAADQFRLAWVARTVRLGPDHPMTARSAYELGRALRALGRFDEAAQMLELCVAVWRKHKGEDYGRISGALDWLATTRVRQGRLEEAERLLEEAFQLNRQHGQAGRELARLHRHLGELRRRQGRLEEAEAAYQEAVRVRQERNEAVEAAADLVSLTAVRLDLGDVEGARATIPTWNACVRPQGEIPPGILVRAACDMSVLMRRAGLDVEADEVLNETVDLARDADNDDAMRRWVAHALVDRSRELILWAGYEEAERHLRTALDLSRDAAPLRGAWVQYHLGDLLWRRGKWDEAEEVLLECLQTQRARFGEQHDATAATLRALGRSKLSRDDTEGAASFLQASLAAYQSVHGEDHHMVADVKCRLGMVRLQVGDPSGAVALCDEAVDMMRAAVGDGDWRVGTLQELLARAWLAAGDAVQAEADARAAYALLESEYGDVGPQTAKALGTIGRALVPQQRYEEAEELLREALHQCATFFGDAHWRTGEQHLWLGMCMIANGATEQGIAELDRSQALLAAVLPPHHVLLNEVLRHRRLAQAGSSPPRPSE